MYTYKEVKPQGNKIYYRVGQKEVAWFIHGKTGNWSSTELSTGLALVSNIKTLDELKERTISLFDNYERQDPEIVHLMIAKYDKVPDTNKTYIYIRQ